MALSKGTPYKVFLFIGNIEHYQKESIALFVDNFVVFDTVCRRDQEKDDNFISSSFAPAIQHKQAYF